MNRRRKNWKYSQLSSIYNNNDLMLIIHYNNMNMVDWTSLKRELNEFDLNTKVVQNNLMYLIFNENNDAQNNIKNVFSGPTAIIYGNGDDTLFKKIIILIEKHPKLLTLAGKCKNDLFNFINLDKIKKLPSLFDLQFDLVNLLLHNQTQLTNLMNVSQHNLIKILKCK